MCNHQNNENNNSKSTFFHKKGLRYLATQNGRQNSISDTHFTHFPVWENCILHVESIEEPLAKKTKTAKSRFETSNEDDNYDDDGLSSNNLSGVLATNRRSERQQPAWQQPAWQQRTTTCRDKLI